METVTITKYKCSICGTDYVTAADAASCESKPISHDKGVKIGDTIKITSGEGINKTATVRSIFVYDKYWGHYNWERYWHTIGLTADLEDWGTRQLTFDSYEPCMFIIDELKNKVKN